MLFACTLQTSLSELVGIKLLVITEFGRIVLEAVEAGKAIMTRVGYNLTLLLFGRGLENIEWFLGFNIYGDDDSLRTMGSDA